MSSFSEFHLVALWMSRLLTRARFFFSHCLSSSGLWKRVWMLSIKTVLCSCTTERCFLELVMPGLQNECSWGQRVACSFWTRNSKINWKEKSWKRGVCLQALWELFGEGGEDRGTTVLLSTRDWWLLSFSLRRTLVERHFLYKNPDFFLELWMIKRTQFS